METAATPKATIAVGRTVPPTGWDCVVFMMVSVASGLVMSVVA